MPIIVKKWGSSAGIRIPAPVLEAAKITLEQPVEVRAEGGHIVIEPVRAGYDLNALIAGITPENRHGESEFGPPAGRGADLTAKLYVPELGDIVWDRS